MTQVPKAKRVSSTASPWPLGVRVKILLWNVCWAVFCVWTPKPLNGWRLLWLKLFGLEMSGRPFVHPRARIQMPWHVTMADQSCVGDRANLYSLGPISLGAGCIVAQEAYLCTGDHALDMPGKPLVTASIVVEEDAFVGARAFVLKGVTIGAKAVVGAGSIVTKDVPAGSTVAGSPAKLINLK